MIRTLEPRPGSLLFSPASPAGRPLKRNRVRLFCSESETGKMAGYTADADGSGRASNGPVRVH